MLSIQSTVLDNLVMIQIVGHNYIDLRKDVCTY